MLPFINHIYFVVCKCFQFGPVQKIVLGYRVNPFQNKPWFLHVCSTSLLKTLWEEEKLLMMSNFSFSHSVFYPFGELSARFINFKIVVCNLFQFGRVQTLSFGKGIRVIFKLRALFCNEGMPKTVLIKQIVLDRKPWEKRKIAFDQRYCPFLQMFTFFYCFSRPPKKGIFW